MTKVCRFLVVIAMLVATVPVQAQSAISWSPELVKVTVVAGSHDEMLVTADFGQSIQETSVEVSSDLSSFIATDPGSLPPLPSGAKQEIRLLITIPGDAVPRVVKGNLILREGSEALAPALPVVLVITQPSRKIIAKGLEVIPPRGWMLDQQALDLGGPISLNNFNGAYDRGGLRPPNGAEIDIATVPLPNLTMPQLIERDLAGAIIVSLAETEVNGRQGFKVSYIVDLLPSIREKNVAVYVPHKQMVYKFFLAYQEGRASEAQLLSTFDSFLATVRFAG